MFEWQVSAFVGFTTPHHKVVVVQANDIQSALYAASGYGITLQDIREIKRLD